MRFVQALAVALCACTAPILAQSGPFGISIGIAGGMPISSIVKNSTAPQSESLADFLLGFASIEGTYTGPREFLVGPTLEVRLPLHLSIEADGLYRPVTVRVAGGPFVSAFPNGVALIELADKSYDSWEIPIVVKYRFPMRHVQPFIEAGPSLRVLDSPLNQWFSNQGVVAGAGVDLRMKRLRTGPEVRVVHWGDDATAFRHPYNSIRNQVELLLDLSF